MRTFAWCRRAVPSLLLAVVGLAACTESPTTPPTPPPRIGGPAFAPGENISVDLDQCANDPRTSPCTWQNGDLNGNNSVYSEDLAVPFRVKFGGLTVGQEYQFHINFDWTAGGHKAYDFLASVNATENVNVCAPIGNDVPAICSPSLPAPTETDFGPDPFGEPINTPTVTVNGAIAFSTFVTAGERKLRGYGVSGVSVTQPLHVDNQGDVLTLTSQLGGNTNGDIIVTFTAQSANAMFTWSGHLAQSKYWDGASTPDGAGEIKGAPWHMRTQDVQLSDGTSAGNKNQDRSIQPSALITADANIQISQSGVNAVGTWHPMTGHVNIDAGAGFVNAPDGTVITFTIASGPGIIVGSNGSTTPLGPPATCTTAGGTGSCTVYLYSTSAGLTTVNASTTVTVNGAPVARSTNGVAPNSGSLTKQWVDAQIDLSPLTATNPLGQEHVVTATVQQDDGLPAGAPGDAATGFGPAAGKTVTFSLLNNTAGASFVGASTCVTNASGVCSITINAANAGSVNIHATTTFSVGGQSLTRATGTGGLNSADAEKTWQSGSIAWTKVKGDGTTKIGGAVFEYRKLPSATWIEVTDDVNGPPTPGVDQDGDPGEFLIAGLTIGSYEIREKTPPPGGYNKDPDTETVILAAGDLNKSIATAFVNPQPRAKIVLSPLTATNEVNSAHVITATVSEDDGLPAGAPGDAANGYTASAGRLVTFSLLNNTAGATFVGGVLTCTTNASGQCSVSINTSTAGSVTIHATTTFTIGAVELTAATNTGGDNSADATKVYVDAQIDLSPLTATNLLGEEHVVTATVLQDDGLPSGAPGDAATGFGPAAGKTVTFSLLNNTAGAAFVGANTCVTNASGVCSITINGGNAGGVDIHATTTFLVGGLSLTRATGTGGLNSADAHKDYVAGSLRWTKHNASGALLGGATFQYRLLPAGPWITVTDNSAPDTDPDNGEFLINGLAIGTYEVKETQAPPGFTLDPSVKQATITAGAPNAVIAVAFVNTPAISGGSATVSDLEFFGTTGTSNWGGTFRVVNTSGGAPIQVNSIDIVLTRKQGGNPTVINGTSCSFSPGQSFVIPQGGSVVVTATCTRPGAFGGDQDYRADVAVHVNGGQNSPYKSGDDFKTTP